MVNNRQSGRQNRQVKQTAPVTPAPKKQGPQLTGLLSDMNQMLQQQEPEIDYTNTYWVCVEKCYFNNVLWKVNEETSYVAGIEVSPYFEQID